MEIIMRRKFVLSGMLILAARFSLLCAADASTVFGNKEGKEYYTNPVIRISAPDPTAIKAGDGYYYLYSTEDIKNLPIFRSDNLVDWVEVGTAFTDATRPNFVDNNPEGKKAAIWAPDIQYINGKYVLFYSLAEWGNHWISTVGYAVSDSPAGPFVPKGKVFNSRDVDVENSIDQFFYEENGKYYMLWGSFRGIYIMELDINSNMDITPKLETKKQIAGNAYEGINLWKKDGYYYLFGSIGSCCEGEKSTYTTVVGRSKSLFGPYLDRKGGSMMDNKHEVVLHKNNRFVGTGHNSLLQVDDEGNTWMLYHAFELNRLDAHRQVLLDKVLWDKDGWPYVENLQPSDKAEAPVVTSPVNLSNGMEAVISLKTPGNPAKDYHLEFKSGGEGGMDFRLVPGADIPAFVYNSIDTTGGKKRLEVMIVATDDIYFNYKHKVKTGYRHDDCMFLMPGFWYRKNLRSPKEAPSFYTSDSWVVREDRLSSPVTVIYDEKEKKSMSVFRVPEGEGKDAMTSHKSGEVILSGVSSIGYVGFENDNGESCLSFGFPYCESPSSYIRKLTLVPEIETFCYLPKGETCTFSWIISEEKSDKYSDVVEKTWKECFDLYKPMLVETAYDAEYMKSVLSNYFKESYVDKYELKYYSGVELETATCEPNDIAEVGFIGRTLLNAFNALEYGESKNDEEMVADARSVFDSYKEKGFSDSGFLREVVKFEHKYDADLNSIRRQSEGVYAILYYLNHEKQNGRKHSEWNEKIRRILDLFLQLQNEDGSFPRKFRNDMSIVDKSGGSTPSAVLPLVMGYKFFNETKYLNAARRAVDYLEKEIISKSDYFSSTLDANCEDKEASLYACSASYYLALVSKGKEHEHYAELAGKAASFALSWYYTWDVPFASGQMLGDLGLKTRGWGNVSVENNHIDVFVFDFVNVLRWLSVEFGESRFADFANVIDSSMRQLLPYDGHMCNIAKKGFYPEVVQHTNWDYGKNGKGFYNDIFGPGWTVASLWELLSPGRAEKFLK